MPRDCASLGWWELAWGDFCLRTVAVTGVTHSLCFCYVTPSMSLDTGAGEGRGALFCVFNILISPFLPAPGTTVALLGPLCGFRQTREGGPGSAPSHLSHEGHKSRVCVSSAKLHPQPGAFRSEERPLLPVSCPKLPYLLWFGRICSQWGFVVLLLRWILM